MEFLNNIITNFTSSSNITVNILNIFFIILLENPLNLKFIKSVTNIKSSNKQNILYVVLLSLAVIFLAFFVQKFYISFIFSTILIYFIFKMTFFKTFLLTSIYTLAYILLYILVLIPFAKTFSINYITIQENPMFYFSFSLIFYTIIALFLLGINYAKFSINSFDYMNTKLKIFYCLFNALSLFLLYFFFNNYILYNLENNTIFIYYIFTFIYLLCNILIYILLAKYCYLKLNLETSNYYNSNLISINDSLRTFKHDFANIMSAISGFIATNDISGLKKYYSSLEKDFNEINILYTLNPELISNSGLYNLLNNKYNLAISYGIKFNLSYFVDINNFDICIYNLTRILGILLDNAIDAAKSSHEKILNVSFKSEPKKCRNIILVQNSYLDKNLNIDNIFKKGITSKDNHTGLGLWEVKKILSKTPNINLYTNKNELFFTQQLEIYDCQKSISTTIA